MRFGAIGCLCGLFSCVIGAERTPEQRQCETVCAERADHVEQDAWCPIEWSADAACEEACSEAAAVDPDVGDAFATCAATNPLCYEFLDTCLLRELFSGPVAQSIHVLGRDLGAFEGRTVWLVDADDPDAPRQEVAIAQGSVDHTWTSSPRPVDWTVRVRFAVDVDGDGACDPSFDLVGTVFGELSDVAVPAWEMVLDPGTSGGDCRGLEAP